ncbi:MAG: endonuclease Q family protein [Candidatus Aminicenantia bacterium]
MNLDYLARWAKVKGISLLGTGDFTHPEWFFLLKERLEQADNGLYQLKDSGQVENEYLSTIPFSQREVFFICSSEISFIYSKKGQVRKVHLLVLAPDLDSVQKLNQRLSGLGNLRADGRPILGLDAKDFLKIVLDVCPNCLVIPAHIWTPWFSLFGANSGFDSVEECFEDLTPYIFVLETGLSSDPAMNWRLSSLDRYTLVSNSDAHSPSKIGREANVFNTELNYQSIVAAIKEGDPEKFLYTIEFFPEEGKYHFDGHRNCHVVFSPKQTIENNYLCPKCGQKLTVGVMHRVELLADREEGKKPPGKIPFKSLIPLNEIIAEATGKASESKTVWDQYFRLIKNFDNEHKILTEVPLEEIEKISGSKISLGVENMRKGGVKIIPGHDGVYGKISLFESKEKPESEEQQLKLF